MWEPTKQVGAQDIWRQAAIDFADLGQHLAAANPTEAVAALPAVAIKRLPGASAASITVYQHGRFRTEGATDERATAADRLQYELGQGPCVDAVLEDHIYNPTDLAHDQRWPAFGDRVVQEYGFTSMLSLRLMVDPGISGLNIYADRPHAFDDDAVDTGILLAAHAGLALTAMVYKDRVQHLERALQTSRDIGVAIGVLMGGYRVTREQAFDMLRVASQHLNRRVADLAAQVAETGALPERHRRGRRPEPPAPQ